MTGNQLNDKAKKPSDAALSETMGKAKKHWDTLIAWLSKEHPGLIQEWKFYGEKYGWQLKIFDKKRAILYMVPHQGYFMAALALKEKAIASLKESNLPASLIEEIENAKAVPEGKPARIEVTTKEQVEMVMKLVGIKLGA
jgi:hypothetical protein